MEKQIKFIRVESSLKGFGIGKGVKYRFEGVRKIIELKAKEGFSYKGFVPIEQRGTGDITVMDLVFEKEN